MFKDSEITFNPTTGYSPTAAQDNIFPNSWDSSPLGLTAGGAPAANTGRDLGIGGEMWLEVLVTATCTSGGSATVNFQLVTDSTVTITTVNILAASGVIAYATLVAGYKVRYQLPAADPSKTNPYKRYINVDALIGTTTLTAGTFDAHLVKNVQEADLYQTGFTVS